jgi:TM2 domain-containing membrane protein YozV
MNHPSPSPHPSSAVMQAPPGGYPPMQQSPGTPAQAGQPVFMPVPGYPYPPPGQPINIVVQNTNTMTQAPGAGALVRVADRNKWVAALLAFFLGGLGVHKFYLGQTGMGVVYLLFCWTFIPVILSLIETIMLVVASEREFDVRFNSQLAR